MPEANATTEDGDFGLTPAPYGAPADALHTPGATDDDMGLQPAPLQAPIIPNSRVPQSVISRVNNGDQLKQSLKKIGDAIDEGFGTEPLQGFTPDQMKWMAPDAKDSDVLNQLRIWGTALGQPMAKAGDFFTRAFNAIPPIAGAVVEQGALGMGASASTAQRLGTTAKESIAIGSVEAPAHAFDPGMQVQLGTGNYYNQVSRVEKQADGTFKDVLIGPVPPPEAVPGQVGTIAQHYGMPDPHPVEALYHGKGVLPAEVLHDADSKPEILGPVAMGQTPDAYDWTGAPMEPPAVAAGAPKTAEGPKAAPTGEGPPEAPVGGPTRLRPISDTDERTISGLAETAEARAIQNKMVSDFGDLPQLGVAKDPMQAARGLALYAKDPDLALQVAMGEKQPPPGTLASAVYTTVVQKAEEAGDIDLIRRLGTQSQFLGQVRRMGQEASFLRNMNKEGATQAISDLQAARKQAYKQASGVDADAAQAAEVNAAQPIVQAAKKAAPMDWQKFMDSITCKEPV